MAADDHQPSVGHLTLDCGRDRLPPSQIVPKLVSLCDAEHAFYTVCRRNDTDCRDKIDVTPVFFHSVGKTRDTSYAHCAQRRRMPRELC